MRTLKKEPPLQCFGRVLLRCSVVVEEGWCSCILDGKRAKLISGLAQGAPWAVCTSWLVRGCGAARGAVHTCCVRRDVELYCVLGIIVWKCCLNAGCLYPVKLNDSMLFGKLDGAVFVVKEAT